jgi:IS30 family transposase
MNVHKNARLTPAGRAVMIDRIEAQDWPVKRAAEASGVSARTAHRWLARHRLGGEQRLWDRSSAPRRSPRKTSPERTAEIERLRRQRMSGPAIARGLGLPRSTVGAVLRRIGLGKLKALEPKLAANRYERAAPVGPWTDAYNLHRPHAGIGDLSPWQRLNNLLGNNT